MASPPPSPSDGTSSESVVTRGGFRLLRRTQTVRRTVEEVYLRDDIACGSAMCPACAHLESDHGHPPPLCADATHYAIPDARALAENVDAFLAAAVPGAGDVVLLASELREAHARGDARLSRALRAFTADPRHARGVKLFPNEHFRATSVLVGLGDARDADPRRRNAVVARRDGSAFAALPATAAGVAARANAVVKAAGWYAAHVARARGILVVVVTDDEALLATRAEKNAMPPGVVLSPPGEYFAAYRPGSRALAERERVEARRRDAEEAERAWRNAEGLGSVEAESSKKFRLIFPNRLSAREAAEGLRAGTLVRGTLRVRADAPDLAVVAAAASGGVGVGVGGGHSRRRGGAWSRIYPREENDADDDDASPAEDEASAGGGAYDAAFFGESSASSPAETARGVGDASPYPELGAGSFRFGGGDVLIPGRRARNRAFDGDEVAVRIAPPERWTRGPDAVAARAGGRGDGDAEEEDDECDDEEHAETTRKTSSFSDAAVEVSRDDADLSDATVPTGEVVAILRPRAADLVATISAEDAEELDRNASSAGTSSSRAAARNSVLAIPADRRAPKVRLLTRRAAELVRQRLLVRVERWPRESRHPEARVLRALGPAGDAATETAALLLEHEILDAPFSRGALAELPAAGAAWRVPAEETRARVDARAWRVMSIDPPGCVDVDDAVGVRRVPAAEPSAEGFRAGAPRETLEVSVHIADVGYFVAENSLLDVEARARGTTTYLVDERVDMLPELLSADLASLVRGKERLAMFCAFSLDPETFASAAPPRFGRSVIKSRHQLDYYQAQAIHDRVKVPTPVASIAGDRAETEAVARDLDALAGFAEALRAARVARGAVELSSAELRFETSADAGVGDLASSVARTADATNERVERKREVPMMGVVAELMIAANAAVATELARVATRRGGEYPALLRKHEPPPPEKFEELRVAMHEIARTELDASSGEALAASLALAASRADDRGADAMFRSLATRAMSEAQYADARFDAGAGAESPSDENDFFVSRKTFAHYGLALPLYTHFTSPIRRYADLAVHRQLWRALEAETSAPGRNRPAGTRDPAGARLELSRLARHLNARTRAAKVAQRRSVELRLTRALRESPVALPAVVRSVVKQGVSLFVPSFHVQVFARVLGGGGGAKLPSTGEERETSDGDRDVTTRVVYDGGVKALAFVARDGSGERGARLRSGARAWVRLSASGGEARAARVECELLDASHPEARLGPAAAAEAAEAAAEAARRVRAMTLDPASIPSGRVEEPDASSRSGRVSSDGEPTGAFSKEKAPGRERRGEGFGDEESRVEASRLRVPALVAATFASLLGDGDARRRAPGDPRRAGVSGSGPLPGSAPALVPLRQRSAAYRLARSAFVAARASAAARATAAAGTRFGGGEEGETRRARRKRRAAAADLRADALRRAMETARED